MGISQVADRFFTYESRLVSFQKAQPISKRRASITSIKSGPKSMKWPHKYLSAQDLAKAGFFYFPTQIHPDNVACFLCHKALDGWEESDDPLAEHLKHSPNCGWAITATIEKLNGYFQEENPSGAKMVEARKATFAERWPHENKRGWKCRTKQMVEGGWKYTPTPLNDDMVSCSYCSLSIHGWEKLDKPTDKHYENSPDCAFFTLSGNKKKIPPIKKVRAQRTRTSKISRLSAQSNVTVSTDTTLVVDLPSATDGDTVLTTSTLVSKKTSGNQKTATEQGRKTRTKKNEVTETTGLKNAVNHGVLTQGFSRDQKRKSQESTISQNSVEVAPLPKKRSTRSRGNTVKDISINTLKNHSALLDSKKKPRNGRSTRKISTVSIAPSQSTLLDDHAINEAVAASPKYESSRMETYTNSDHRMFGLDSINIDEAMIDAELNAMEIDDSPQSKTRREKNQFPHKSFTRQNSGSKRTATIESQNFKQDNINQPLTLTSPSSLSNYSRKKRGLTPTLQTARVLPCDRARGSSSSSKNEVSTVENQYTDESAIDSENDTDGSIASQSTVASSNVIRSSIKKWRNEGPRRNIEEIVKISEGLGSIFSHQEQTRSATSMKPLNTKTRELNDPSSFLTPLNELDREFTVDSNMEELAQSMSIEVQNLTENPSKSKLSHNQKQGIIQADSEIIAEFRRDLASSEEPDLIETTRKLEMSPFPESMTHSSVRQTSISSSSNSSNAENRPPSSKPATFANHSATPQTTRRVLISFSTPVQSPSKRNIITGLISKQPWTAVELESIFLCSPSSPSGVLNCAGLLGTAVDRAKDGMLTTPEKNMTVEEWIHYNAQLAEEKLRNECERIVGNFEREGARAMRALEGIDCCN